MIEHPEYQGLHADVLAHPAEDAPRLILCDWLEDHAHTAHAALIREQLAEPQTSWRLRYEGFGISGVIRDPEFHDRLWPLGLLADLSLCDTAVEYWWHRGFIHQVVAPLAFLMQHLPALCKRHPIERVDASDKRPRGSTNGRDVMWCMFATLSDCADPDDLPYEVWDDLPYEVWNALPRKRTSGSYSHWARYDSEKAAQDDLSAALLHLARHV